MNIKYITQIEKYNGNPPIDLLEAVVFKTPLGEMIAIADSQKLYLLEFTERKNLEKNIQNLSKNEGPIVWRENALLKKVKKSINQYFQRPAQKFSIPIKTKGTSLQEKVWKALSEIPCGKTISYSELANEVGCPNAQRAVANAVGNNQLAILVPCHRVINKSGKLGGYAGGISRKEWLLSHEAKA